MLKIENINVSYGEVQVLHNVSLDVEEGEIVALIGANAAGKTTTIKTISGLLKPTAGKITFNGTNIAGLSTSKIVELGIVQVPEGRLLFPEMSVLENLELGAYTPQARKVRHETIKTVFQLFPILEKRSQQLAGSLSGGEQQMCALGRGLMAKPKLLMVDETSLGLSPIMAKTVFESIKQINKTVGMTILLVEQNVHWSLRLAGRCFVLENGKVVLNGPSKELKENPHLQKAYLGM